VIRGASDCGPAAHWEITTSPDWVVTDIRCGDVWLLGTLIVVDPDEALALTR
jgi:hypothetical protein